MNPPELAGWPGTHSPCSPRAIAASYFFDVEGAIGAFIVSGRAARQTRAGCRRSMRYLSPSLERQTRARGKIPHRPLARRRLSGFSPGPENPYGACSLPGRPRSPVGTHWCGGTAGAIDAALDAGSGRRCVHRASFPARRKTCSGAAYYKRLIRGLPPSARLPFQARGKLPDRLLATSTCLPSRPHARVIAPD